MRRLLLLSWMLCQVAVASAQDLKFEAEEWTTPKDAWQVDQFGDDHWNLWSTDQNAKAKWSGGIVLQGPVVKADRQTPEEGAPPLHTVITGLPAGKYELSMNGTRALGISFDGQLWQKSTGGILADSVTITDGKFEIWFDDRYLHTAQPGSAYVDFLLFSPIREVQPKPKVTGYAKTRVVEHLDRGLVAVTGPDGVHVSWRLQPGDPADIGFNVYRQLGNGQPAKVNTTPIVQTTDLMDTGAPEDGAAEYTVKPVIGGKEGAAEGQAARQLTDYVSLPLDGDYTFQKCGLGDLDGDGRLDYVIKQPGSNIDPYKAYWHKSPGTYKIEAYTHDGKLLWRHDLGWAIEQGIWYSPYLVYDFDGDGRAEVAVKMGEGDPRDADGRVFSGPEWAVVLDGQTGQERCRAPWPSREGFGEGDAGYNYAARNQLAVAYLDGKTPCLVVLRGTYTLMKAEAWQLVGNQLDPLWKYSSDEGSRRLRGQGAHFTQAVDLDGDGRDEIVLGSQVLDDNGVPLWGTGLGHPDCVYIGDHDPTRPGMEIYYGVETHQPKNGMCMADAKTGEILWGWDQPTVHVHSSGMCSDIDPRYAGAEMYAQDSVGDHQAAGESWLWNAAGKIVQRGLPWGFSRNALWWDADLQREVLMGSTPVNFGGKPAQGLISGSVVLIADVLGDWREEVIASVAGELRIYTTAIPAFDRRTTLLADPLYRLDAAMCAQGYTQVPTLQTSLEATAPNLNLTILDAGRDEPNVQVVVSAPMDQPVKGTLAVTGSGGLVTLAQTAIDLKAGERKVLMANATPDKDGSGEMKVTAALTGDANLTTTALLTNGLQDGGFERASGGKPVGWTWWSRENTGEATIVKDVVHGGKQAALIVHDGERDWAFSNVEKLAVKPGDKVAVRGWAKSDAAGSCEIAIVALKGGQTVTWSIGGAKASGTFDWRKLEGEATVPEGVDQVYARWVGVGKTRLWVDDAALMVE